MHLKYRPCHFFKLFEYDSEQFGLIKYMVRGLIPFGNGMRSQFFFFKQFKAKNKNSKWNTVSEKWNWFSEYKLKFVSRTKFHTKILLNIFFLVWSFPLIFLMLVSSLGFVNECFKLKELFNADSIFQIRIIPMDLWRPANEYSAIKKVFVFLIVIIFTNIFKLIFIASLIHRYRCMCVCVCVCVGLFIYFSLRDILTSILSFPTSLHPK